MIRTQVAGSWAALVAAILFGLSAPLAKGLVGMIDPWLLAGLLYLGSGLGLSLVWWWRQRHGQRREGRLRAHHLPWLLAAIASGGVIAPVLLVVGLAHTDAATGALLLNLEAVATALLAWLVVREHTSRRLMLGLLLIVAGGLVLAWPSAPVAGSSWWGPLLIAAACCCWGIDNTCTRPLSVADPVTIATIKGLVAGAVNTVIAFALGAAWPSWSATSGALLVGFGGYGISLVLFVVAMRHLGSGRTGAYFAIAPFVGAIGAFVGGAPLTWMIMAAGVLMGAGVWLHLSERHEHPHTHEPLEHDHRHRHDDAHHDHAHAPAHPTGDEHSHSHRHQPRSHSHPHLPDLHHRHGH